MNTCKDCIHFGQLKNIRGEAIRDVCLAPVTTEPPTDGMTPAFNRFVYETHPEGYCELHTDFPATSNQ